MAKDKAALNPRSSDLPRDPDALTVKHLDNLPVKAKSYDRLVGKGLVLRIQPSGKITFRYAYRVDGKARVLTVGSYPGTPLKDVRGIYKKAVAAVELGKDPAGKAQKKKAKRLKKARSKKARSQAMHIEKLANLFLAHIDEPGTLNRRDRPYADKTRREYRQHLLTHFAPAFEGVAAEDVRAKDIKAWLKEKATKAPSQANHIKSAISAMFAWAVDEDLLDSNPVAGMKKPGTEANPDGKNRALDYNPDLQECVDTGELRQFWTGLEDINPVHKLATRMVLLTAQRPGEVMRAEWEHIIEDRWVIPASHTKNKRAAHKVPLTPMLQALLDELHEYTGESDYLFPQCRWQDNVLSLTYNQRTGKHEPLDPSTVSKAMSKALSDMESFTTHDLRRTASTHMKWALDYSEIDIGVLLNHSFGGVTAIYARGVNIDKLRIMLTTWQNHLQGILDQKQPASNVRKLRG